MNSKIRNPLATAIQVALATRDALNVVVPELDEPVLLPGAVDLYSSDFLSLTTSTTTRQLLLSRIADEPMLFGSTGSRLLTGNGTLHVRFEERAQAFFGSSNSDGTATAALLCNSGYDANLAFFHAVPQEGDVVVFDELIHASIRDGIAASRCRGAQYAFGHNSAQSFRSVLSAVLGKHQNIAAGRSTLFVAVETLYSMDGDYAPLKQVIEAAEELVPKGCLHIMVDEAHTTGIFGGGRGLLHELGLNTRVHSVIHPFSKGWGMGGGTSLRLPLLLTTSS